MYIIHKFKVSAAFAAVTFVIAALVGLFPAATIFVLAIAGWSMIGDVLRPHILRTPRAKEPVPVLMFQFGWSFIGGLVIYAGVVDKAGGFWPACIASVCAAFLVFFILADEDLA